MKLIGTNISYMTLFGSEKCRYSTTTDNKKGVEGKPRILENNYTTIFLLLYNLLSGTTLLQSW